MICMLGSWLYCIVYHCCESCICLLYVWCVAFVDVSWFVFVVCAVVALVYSGCMKCACFSCGFHVFFACSVDVFVSVMR